MREYNAGLIAIALICNTVLVMVGILAELISTLDTYLLVWFVPSVAFTIWASALYHKNSS